LFKPEYNILKLAGSSIGYKHSEESKFKISKGLMGDKNPNYGKNRSEETRVKISVSMKGNYSMNRPTAQKIEVTDLQTGISISYNSMGQAAKALNILPSSISSYFAYNQKTPFKKRYLFKKID
jgi:group I intron endonuclease